MVPIFTSLIFWGFVAAVVLVPLYLRHRTRKLAHETLRAMVAQGREVSPELIEALQADMKSQASLPPGVGTENAGYLVAAIGLGGLVFAAAIAAALAWNRIYTGSSISGLVIAGCAVGLMMIGGGLVLIGRRTQRLLKAKAD